MNTARRPPEGAYPILERASLARGRDKAPFADQGILPALVIVWAISALRVVGGLWRRETFGVEATLAFIALIAIPLLAIGPRKRVDRSKLN